MTQVDPKVALQWPKLFLRWAHSPRAAPASHRAVLAGPQAAHGQPVNISSKGAQAGHRVDPADLRGASDSS